MTLSFHERIFPNQSFNNNLYKHKDDFHKTLYGLLENQISDIHFNKFKLKTHHRVDFEEMSTPPTQLSLLKFLIGMTSTKTFLEIGTFIGNTSMHVADFIGSDAEVVTIEKFDEFADIANENFKINNFEKNISLHVGDAYEVMQKLPDNHFDFIYVDGDKGRYPEFVKLSEKKLSPQGLILVDDILFHGDVLNSDPETEKGRGCKKVLENYKNNNDFHSYIMPINNGIYLLKKK